MVGKPDSLGFTRKTATPQPSTKPGTLPDRLENIQKEARRLRDALHLEFNEIRGHLYFDAITDPQQGIVHKPSD